MARWHRRWAMLGSHLEIAEIRRCLHAKIKIVLDPSTRIRVNNGASVNGIPTSYKSDRILWFA
jgi:hypothetical protein